MNISAWLTRHKANMLEWQWIAKLVCEWCAHDRIPNTESLIWWILFASSVFNLYLMADDGPVSSEPVLYYLSDKIIICVSVFMCTCSTRSPKYLYYNRFHHMVFCTVHDLIWWIPALNTSWCIRIGCRYMHASIINNISLRMARSLWYSWMRRFICRISNSIRPNSFSMMHCKL